MIEQQTRVVRWIWLAWAIPTVLVAEAFYFDWHLLFKSICIVAVITGAINQLNESSRLQNYQQDARKAAEKSEH